MAGVLLFGGLLVAASVVVSLGVAFVLRETGLADRLGRFRANVAGVAMCFVVAFALFALIDPDPLPWPETMDSYLRRTFGITVFAAFIWLPVFLGVFSALVRRGEDA